MCSRWRFRLNFGCDLQLYQWLLLWSWKGFLGTKRVEKTERGQGKWESTANYLAKEVIRTEWENAIVGSFQKRKTTTIK